MSQLRNFLYPSIFVKSELENRDLLIKEEKIC